MFPTVNNTGSLWWRRPNRLSKNNKENYLPDLALKTELALLFFFLKCTVKHLEGLEGRKVWIIFFFFRLFLFCVLFPFPFIYLFIYSSFFLQKKYCAIRFPNHEWDDKKIFLGWTLLSSVSWKQTIPDSRKGVISDLSGCHLPSPAVLWSSTSSQTNFKAA